ncbi:molybdate ABC transporter substrate-binding protein [Vibrio sp. FNV 38]|nr:molybdate ABC transporter substrate-binding protein [Vibrio sp. FNV 38]
MEYNQLSSSRYSRTLSLTTLSFAILTSSVCSAETLTIAVANNFYRPMQTLAHQFEQQTEHNIEISTGSSGQLATQIEHGAPFDLFFSADQKRPSYLVAANKAHGQSTYAKGVLALWTQSTDWQPPMTSSEPVSLSGKIAIADPKVAPYGEAAVAALNYYASYEAVVDNALFGKGLNATYQYAATGNAQSAFLALSQLRSNAGKSANEKASAQSDDLGGKIWIVPEESYPEILQDFVYIEASDKSSLAETFIHYLSSEKARETIANFGYKVTM